MFSVIKTIRTNPQEHRFVQHDPNSQLHLAKSRLFHIEPLGLLISFLRIRLNPGRLLSSARGRTRLGGSGGGDFYCLGRLDGGLDKCRAEAKGAVRGEDTVEGLARGRRLDMTPWELTRERGFPGFRLLSLWLLVAFDR